VSFDEDFPEDDEMEECPKCHGTGLTPEGWDCEYCDGDGYIEI
jgi:DnaJ-class molecular chaperone